MEDAAVSVRCCCCDSNSIAEKMEPYPVYFLKARYLFLLLLLSSSLPLYSHISLTNTKALQESKQEIANATRVCYNVSVKGVVLLNVSLSRKVVPSFARILLHTSLGKKHSVAPTKNKNHSSANQGLIEDFTPPFHDLGFQCGPDLFILRFAYDANPGCIHHAELKVMQEAMLWRRSQAKFPESVPVIRARFPYDENGRIILLIETEIDADNLRCFGCFNDRLMMVECAFNDRWPLWNVMVETFDLSKMSSISLRLDLDSSIWKQVVDFAHTFQIPPEGYLIISNKGNVLGYP
ncbi:hypothetical protein RIF29_09958 [Crotalaria pallida]|uniref:Uncharacterized protein n=1 Tax=Crotalaria pallida TaxID=3830 RepID=A0AAN9FV89_CROPI